MARSRASSSKTGCREETATALSFGVYRYLRDHRHYPGHCRFYALYGQSQESLALAKENAILAETAEAAALFQRDQRQLSVTQAIASQEVSKKNNSLSLLLAIGAGRTAETAAAL